MYSSFAYTYRSLVIESAKAWPQWVLSSSFVWFWTPNVSLNTSLQYFLDLPQNHSDFNKSIESSFRRHTIHPSFWKSTSVLLYLRKVFLSWVFENTCKNLTKTFPRPFNTSEDTKTIQEELVNAWKKQGCYPNFTVIQRNVNKSKCIPSTCLKFSASFIPETLLSSHKCCSAFCYPLSWLCCQAQRSDNLLQK